jgi:hypothetical protein
LANADLQVIVKNLLVSLPSYRNPNSSRGNDLLQLLLDKAKTSFRTESRPGDNSSFDNVRLYLNLAKYIVLTEKVASPTTLLHFFCASMIGKMTLQRLRPGDRVLIICDTAEILTACHEDAGSRGAKQWSFLQRQITDACPILLEAGDHCVVLTPAISHGTQTQGLSDSNISHIKSWNACKALLQVCLRVRHRSSSCRGRDKTFYLAQRRNRLGCPYTSPQFTSQDPGVTGMRRRGAEYPGRSNPYQGS